MQTELIEFPEYTDGRYRDSHVGGLFVMLFIPEPENWNHQCYVDVNIEATSPDVLVYATGDEDFWPNSWSGGTVYNPPWKIEQKVIDLVRAAAPADEPNDMLQWVIRARSADRTSVPMLVAMHLGSDHRSLWDENNGHYWYGTYKSLTEAGRALYDSLRAAYGIDPIIATFLDT